MIAALTDALTHQVDPRDGIWLDTVTAHGRPKAPRNAHNWKADYHAVRAIVKFVEAFAPPGQ
jgi:mannose/cellobiose epimerase-like protein (N-acyl-D-glucosamine 2-epimerase family)